MNPALLVLGLLAALSIALAFVDATVTVSTENVDWGYVGIGAVAVLGLLLLATPLGEKARRAVAGKR